MSSNFLEIENATFAASKKNKVNNVSLTIKKEGEITKFNPGKDEIKQACINMKNELTEEKINEIKEELTVKPAVSTDFGAVSNPFPIYLESKNTETLSMGANRGHIPRN